MTDLIARLQALAAKHEKAGRISHALGVRSAIALVRRAGIDLVPDSGITARSRNKPPNF